MRHGACQSGNLLALHVCSPMSFPAAHDKQMTRTQAVQQEVSCQVAPALDQMVCQLLLQLWGKDHRGCTLSDIGSAACKARQTCQCWLSRCIDMTDSQTSKWLMDTNIQQTDICSTLCSRNYCIAEHGVTLMMCKCCNWSKLCSMSSYC